MEIEDIKNSALLIDGEIFFNQSIKNLNWFNIGGKTKIFFKPKSLKGLIEYLKLYNSRGKIFILGNGSNVLFDDETFQTSLRIPDDTKSCSEMLTMLCGRLEKVSKEWTRCQYERTKLVQRYSEIGNLTPLESFLLKHPRRLNEHTNAMRAGLKAAEQIEMWRVFWTWCETVLSPSTKTKRAAAKEEEEETVVVVLLLANRRTTIAVTAAADIMFYIESRLLFARNYYEEKILSLDNFFLSLFFPHFYSFSLIHFCAQKKKTKGRRRRRDHHHGTLIGKFFSLLKTSREKRAASLCCFLRRR